MSILDISRVFAEPGLRGATAPSLPSTGKSPRPYPSHTPVNTAGRLTPPKKFGHRAAHAPRRPVHLPRGTRASETGSAARSRQGQKDCRAHRCNPDGGANRRVAGAATLAGCRRAPAVRKGDAEASVSNGLRCQAGRRISCRPFRRCRRGLFIRGQCL